jgi:hypothetical protein
LIVERLDGETLVYDTERNEAHALSGAGAAEFLAADDEVSRRQVLTRLALAGAAAAGTGALVKTIVAPTAARAQSATCNPPCQGAADFCCGGTCVGGPINCCAGVVCILGACSCCGGSTLCAQPNICCPGGSAFTCAKAQTAICNSNSECCSNSCVNGSCA